MMSGMVAGVQGISATIMELDGSFDTSTPGAPPDIKALDAMISISSSNPQQLLLMAANMQPGMPPLQLPPDGTPIDFPAPIPLPSSAAVKLAIKGNHIVAFTGNKSAKLADKLAQEKLEANGLFSFNMDFGQYMKLITSAAQNIPSPDGDQNAVMTEKDKAMLEAMSNIKMQFVESFDIDKNGVAFDVKMTMD
jgi:replicative DNA helicase